MVNGFAVPKAFEIGIGKADHQNVLTRFLAEIMVNAADLLLVGEARQLAVERVGGREVVAEGLLDDEPLPAAFAGKVQQARAVNLLDGLSELARLRGGATKHVLPQRRDRVLAE